MVGGSNAKGFHAGYPGWLGEPSADAAFNDVYVASSSHR